MKAVIEGMGDTVPVNKLCATLGFPRSCPYGVARGIVVARTVGHGLILGTHL